MRCPFRILFCLIWITQISAVSVTQVATNFAPFCFAAANDENLLINFRSDEACRGMIENVTFTQGLDMLHVIQKKYPYLLTYFNKICLDDRFGNPVAYNFPNVGAICPTTLRYIKIAGDLVREFGNLNQYHIVEIGGGYGGQCKILHDISGFTAYTFVDLPQCTPLIMKYLHHHCIPNVACIHNTEIENARQYDLLISNYAFSEIDCTEQRYYIDNLINAVPRGYITYNAVSSYYGLTSLTVDEVVAALQKDNRTIVVTPENPLTGENNVLIVWYPQNL